MYHRSIYEGLCNPWRSWNTLQSATQITYLSRDGAMVQWPTCSLCYPIQYARHQAKSIVHLQWPMYSLLDGSDTRTIRPMGHLDGPSFFALHFLVMTIKYLAHMLVSSRPMMTSCSSPTCDNCTSVQTNTRFLVLMEIASTWLGNPSMATPFLRLVNRVPFTLLGAWARGRGLGVSSCNGCCCCCRRCN